MKYIRFLSHDGFVNCGILNSEGLIEIVEGDILGEHRRTGKKYMTQDVKEYMVPVDIPAIIALGGNYADHAKECKESVPALPLIFLKAVTSLIAHKKPIILPREAPSEVDYEAELGVIIGKRAKNIHPEQASEYIFGYTCVNDVSARDCQLKLDRQWARGKSFDTFAPVGPVIETEIDPYNTNVKLLLNGECLQNDNTKNMIYNVFEIVSYLSRNMTLLAGTLILTGTPAGVGFARDPKVFLAHGDKVAVEIDGIGRLENFVEAE